jgi:hypothetical protein
MPTRPLRRFAIVASVVIAAALVAPSRAQEKQPAKRKDPAEVMKSLEQLVKDYQDENVALRERVKELEGQVQALKQNRVVNVVPQPATPGQVQGQVPPTWQPFQFNGATYYVVPLAAGRGGTHTQLLSQTPEQAGRGQGSPPTIVFPAKQK